MVPAFPSPTLGMLWEMSTVIDIWKCSHLPYTYINIPRNRMEGSMNDSEHSTHWVWWSFVVPLIGIWGAISYSSLMVLILYGYDQCVPPTASLNRVEASVWDLGFWKKLEEIQIKWAQFKGKRKVLDDVAELTNKICNLEMRLRGRDEEVRRQREHH
ncbi:hypothetical protein GOBAR_DD01229 [Gossypium barbadense]|nr:hypothetical protein GOBAR_DD01229 [Gossypium barbadense]